MRELAAALIMALLAAGCASPDPPSVVDADVVLDGSATPDLDTPPAGGDVNGAAGPDVDAAEADADADVEVPLCEQVVGLALGIAGAPVADPPQRAFTGGHTRHRR